MIRGNQLVIFPVDIDFICNRAATLCNLFFVVYRKDLVWPNVEAHAVFKRQGAESPLRLTEISLDIALGG